MSRLPEHLLLLAPSANRVYAEAAPRLVAAEVTALCPGLEVPETRVAGVDYLALSGPVDPAAVGRASAALALFATEGDLLRPVPLPRTDLFPDDLVSIQKYAGKTNEHLTRLVLNLTLAAVSRPGPWTVLDPMCGRGTTLLTAWTLGHDAAGVERDEAAIEQLRGFLTTYLKRARLRHQVRMDRVRRDGIVLGKRLDVTASVSRELSLSVMPGDAAESRQLWGKRTCDAFVTDAPYGVVHGAHAGGTRRRSPADLLAAALPGWAEQLRSGGALGIAWNTLGLPRDDLAELVSGVGLVPRLEAPYDALAHRVDSSIVRDVLVATKP